MIDITTNEEYFILLMIETDKDVWHWIAIYCDGMSLEYYDSYGE